MSTLQDWNPPFLSHGLEGQIQFWQLCLTREGIVERDGVDSGENWKEGRTPSGPADKSAVHAQLQKNRPTMLAMEKKAPGSGEA